MLYRLMDSLLFFVVMAIGLVIVIGFMGFLIQNFPKLAGLFTANVQPIIGISELAVAIVLGFTAMIEVLPFLSVNVANIGPV